jgi:hypothetical protein
LSAGIHGIHGDLALDLDAVVMSDPRGKRNVITMLKVQNASSLKASMRWHRVPE